MENTDYITCLLCGTYSAKDLRRHIRAAHQNVSVKAYRALGPVESAAVREQTRQATNRHRSKARSEQTLAVVTCQICKSYSARTLMPHVNHAHPEVGSRGYVRLGLGPMKASDLSDRVKRSLAGRIRTSEQRENLSKSHRGVKLSESHRESLRLSHIGVRPTPENRSKRSRSMAARVQAGATVGGYLKGYETTRFGRIFCRSSLERNFLLKAANDESVLSLRYEPIRLSYTKGDGIERSYVPDYLVETRNGVYLVEVKPAKLISYNQQKADAARRWSSENGAVFTFITEEQVYSPSETTFPWATMGATAAALPALAGHGQ